MSQSLVNAIYERYGELDECTSFVSCSINCSEFSGSLSSSSCSPVSSPMNEAELNDASNQSIATSPKPSSFVKEISFYVPPACSPKKTRKKLTLL